jgi:hypothetical protein
VDAREGGGKVDKHGFKRCVDKTAPGHDHIVMTGTRTGACHARHSRAKSAPDAISLNGIPDFARDGKAKPDERGAVGTVAGLERQKFGMGAPAARCGLEVRAPSQTIKRRGLD